MSNAILKTNSNDQRRVIRYADVEEKLIFYLTSFTLLGVLVMNQTHIETNDHIKMAPKLEILVRLGFTGIAGLLGIYGFLFVPKIRNAFFQFPGAWVLGISVFYVTGTLFAELRNYAIPYLITYISVVLFAPFAFYRMGTKSFIRIVLASSLVTLFGSWFLYLAMPDYGVMLEVIDASGEAVARMGGTSHPNSLAGIAVLMMVIVSYLVFEGKMRWSVFLGFLGLGVVTLVCTGTRVAAVAALVSLAIVYRNFWLRKDVVPFTAAIVVVVALAATYVFSNESNGLFSAQTLSSATRSGDVDELTSFTGRAQIWKFVIQKIEERPLRGYGPGTAKHYLEQKDLLLHPHNVVLAMAFLGGIFCGLCAVMMFLQQLFVSLGGKYRLAALISLVIIMNSITETPIFDYVPGTPTMLWMAALFWPLLDDNSL